MKKSLLTILCASVFLLSSNNQVRAEDTDPPAGGEGKKLCGDGTCDEMEKKTGKCSADCGESTNPGDTGSKSKLCGDGTCDEFESKSGKCAQDCTSEDND